MTCETKNTSQFNNYGLSGTLWPIHLKPLPDELLSSWLVRLARASGMVLHTFCDLNWRHMAMWNRDIDKSAGTEILQVLARKTGTSFARVKLTTLASYQGWLYVNHNPNGNTKWILPLGVYHRLRTKPGIQYCAACLQEDEEPYFRRTWRLGLACVCLKHEKLLLANCPKCRMPINYHRISLDKSSIANCYYCDFDLRKAIKFQVGCTDYQLRAQCTVLGILKNGWRYVPTVGPVYSVLYFEVAHQIIKILLMGRRSHELLNIILEELCMEFDKNNITHYRAEFERYGAQERLVLLSSMVWLLEKWPDRFIEFCKQQSLLSFILLRDMADAPYWYWKTVRRHLYEPTYKLSPEEISAGWEYLGQHSKRKSKHALSQLLGVRDLFRKRRNFNW